ncbi:hypothetical protein [Polyangium jinanense]|uniref:Fibronectin type-III domain-containing protein n=1 Tax=Polyangium jinanense TaxID=2829994 RepID=A0A9X3XII4_9BACT|nr:hypothetical protein [Polyangium jinanense]MDC3988711.1 hypothetical protein [Polyangium jinanense]
MQHHAPMAILTLSLLVSACGSGTSSDTGGIGGTGGGGAGGTAGPVTGTYTDVYITDTGEIKDVPRIYSVPSYLPITALIPKGDGSFDEIYGGYDEATGAFSIPDVPYGEYYLGVGQRVIVTSERTFDLGDVFGGRPDVEPVEASLSISANIDNLEAWDTGDSLGFFSLGGYADGRLDVMAQAKPTKGTTSLSNYSADLLKLDDRGIVDGSKGDKVVLTQLTARDMIPDPAAYRSYRAVARSTEIAGVVVDPLGPPAVVTGTLAALPQTQLSFTWKPTAFVSSLLAANPAATPSQHAFFLLAEPGGKDRAATSPRPTLLSLSDGDDATDEAYSLEYGNPFPSSYATITQAFLKFTVPMSLGGASWTESGYIIVSSLVDSVDGGIVEPIISPPRNVKIAGMPATNTLEGVGTRPTISWDPPALGTATFYRVRIMNCFAGGCGMYPHTEFYTTGTSITFSQCDKCTGEYYAVITAHTHPYDPKVPFRHGPVGGRADAVTPVFTL